MGLQPRPQPYLLYPLVRETWVSRAPRVAECANNGTTVLPDTGPVGHAEIKVRAVGSTPI